MAESSHHAPRRTVLQCSVNRRHRFGGGQAEAGRPCPSGDGTLELRYTHCDLPSQGCGCSLDDHNDGMGCRTCKTECGIACRPQIRERTPT